MEISSRGIILTDNVNIDWLKALTPQYFSDYIKFVIDVETTRVCVGMEIHRDCEVSFDTNLDNLYGGNLYFDGHIIYESTLNVSKNKEKKGFRGNPRIITDEKDIEMLNAILFSWIEL